MPINLTIPQTTQELRPKITVVGVGGAGCNAVNNMINANLEGVEFLVMNTDGQSLSHSLAPRKIQLGSEITQGLGAGSKPEMGKLAAEESMEEVLAELNDCNMVFITAGMGGGTGTGAAPIIAKAAKDRGILTVGVVTKPFSFEGQRRMAQADEGISALQAYVDTLIVIPNQNLFRLANERTTFADAFNMADAVLHQGVCGVTDLMIKPGIINLDFADIRSVMTEMGKAMMGTGEGTGENRAIEAAEAAINNPLLDDTTMQGAQALLINITGGMDMTLFEVDEAANRIRREVDEDATIIFGSAFDERLEGIIRVSVVATGFEAAEQTGSLPFSIAKAPAMSNINEVSPIPGLFSAAIPAEQVPEAHNMGRFADKLSPPSEMSESVAEKIELSDTKTPSSTQSENDEPSQASPLENDKGVEKTDALPEQMNAAEQNLPKASSPELSPLGLMNAHATSATFSENEANKSSIADEKLGSLKVEETENTAQPVFIPEPTEPMSPNASYAPVRQKTGLMGRISQMWGASAAEGSDSQKSNQSPTANSLGGSTPSLSPLLAKRSDESEPAIRRELAPPISDEAGTSNGANETPKILDLPTISGGQAAMAFQEVQEQEDPDELDIPAFLRRQAN